MVGNRATNLKHGSIIIIIVSVLARWHPHSVERAAVSKHSPTERAQKLQTLRLVVR